MTRAGKSLENTNGWIPCQSDSSQKCFGIMHIPEIDQPIVADGIAGIDYLTIGIRKIIGTVPKSIKMVNMTPVLVWLVLPVENRKKLIISL